MPDTTSPTSIQRVLTPLALTARATALAHEAERWASSLGAELSFLHVGESDAQSRSTLDGLLRPVELEARTLQFRTGKVDRVICQHAEEIGADLILAGALEEEGPLGYYLGSVARRVARRANCSVMLLAEPRVEPVPPRRWVVTVKYNAAGLETLGFTMELARREHPALVEATCEYELPALRLATERDLDSRAAERVHRRMHEEEQLRLAEFLMSVNATGVNLRPICLRGREGWEAAEYARRERADLLIMPAPPRLTFWDKVFQHGVEFALESLPCALLLYRPRRNTAPPTREP